LDGIATVVTIDVPLPSTVHVMAFDRAARASVDTMAASDRSRIPALAVRTDGVVLGIITKASSLGNCSR
jgi:hypothetical protein